MIASTSCFTRWKSGDLNKYSRKTGNLTRHWTGFLGIRKLPNLCISTQGSTVG